LSFKTLSQNIIYATVIAFMPPLSSINVCEHIYMQLADTDFI